MAKEESQFQRISINTAAEAEAAVPIISFTDNLHLGVCDASCEMHRLHDVLQFLETLKNCSYKIKIEIHRPCNIVQNIESLSKMFDVFNDVRGFRMGPTV